MNKKGVNFTMDSIFFYIMTLAIASVMFFLFILVARGSTSNYYEFPRGVEDYLASSRFSACMHHGYYPFAVEWDGFEEQFGECVAEKSTSAYRLQLAYGEESKTTKSSSWDEGKPASPARAIDVLITKNNAVQQGRLLVEVQHE